jgi:hypothetical protein
MFSAEQAERLVCAFEGIAESLVGIKREIRNLGNGNACTDMGAIEGLGAAIETGLRGIAESLTKE